MKNLFITLLILTLIFSKIPSNGQVNDQKIRTQVLEKEIVDSLFIFGKWTENGRTETHLKFLGQTITKKGQTFKVVNSIWFWGLSKRATSRILIFNEQNQYVGNYCVSQPADLPTKMENGKLIFKNNKEYCDIYLLTIIDIKKGLPKRFFKKCKGEYGDIYFFE